MYSRTLDAGNAHGYRRTYLHVYPVSAFLPTKEHARLGEDNRMVQDGCAPIESFAENLPPLQRNAIAPPRSSLGTATRLFSRARQRFIGRRSFHEVRDTIGTAGP